MRNGEATAVKIERDHRQVIDGILHQVRTGVQCWDLPERLGPWKTIYEPTD
ncbi:transposase [Streptomyces sp. NPDC056638]|uniref:transposase n=1 Tax=Streptomyces sp. NPDC056638 TaxID=3345887 RepID=UPI003682AA7E